MNTIEKAIALVIVLVFVWVALKKAPTKAYSYRCAVLSLWAVASVAIGGGEERTISSWSLLGVH